MLLLIVAVGLLTAGGSSSAIGCPDFCRCNVTASTYSCENRAPTYEDLAGSNNNNSKFTALRLKAIEAGELRKFLDDTTSDAPLFFRQLRRIELVESNVSAPKLPWDKLTSLSALDLSNNSLSSVVNLFDSASAPPQLTELIIEGNRLVSLHAEAFIEVPGLKILRLKGNSIFRVDEDAFSDLALLEELILSNNALSGLPTTALAPLRALKKLDLSGNKLAIVDPNWFKTLTRLEQLNLRKNGLKVVTSSLMEPLAYLGELMLSENSLMERDVTLLMNMGRLLRVVDASQIGLARVPVTLSRSIKELTLRGNMLTSITCGDLDTYPLLEILNVEGNKLQVVEEDALGRLDYLRELYLGVNLLPVVPKSLPRSLKVLSLTRNSITQIKSSDFLGLYNLTDLDLSNNIVTEIEEGSFNQLASLKFFALSNNPVKRLPPNMFSASSELASLDLSVLTFLQAQSDDKNKDTSFPIATLEKLKKLDLSRSPVLTGQLLGDNAALSACKSLEILDLTNSGVESIRTDLSYMSPKLRLILRDNHWNCQADQFWLLKIVRSDDAPRCIMPKELEGKLLSDIDISKLQFASPTTVTEPTTTTTIVRQYQYGLDRGRVMEDIFGIYTRKSNKSSTTTTEEPSTTEVIQMSSTTSGPLDPSKPSLKDNFNQRILLKINAIFHGKDNPFTDVNATEINATRMELTKIPPSMSKVVKTLFMENNLLTTLSVEDLFSYSELELLDLNRNRLQAIEKNAFKNLNLLTELRLDDNRLKVIPEKFPKSLKNLFLRVNLIEQVRKSDFQGLSNLEVLDLGMNSIGNVEEKSFGKLPNLHEFSLNSNYRLTYLPSNILRDSTQLKSVTLINLMNIQDTDRQKFPLGSHLMRNLQLLGLKSSPILAKRFLADNVTLLACESLSYVDISNTNISSLTIEVFYKLPRLRQINLSDNRWNCTDDQFKINPRWLNLTVPPTCYWPEEFNGTKLDKAIDSYNRKESYLRTTTTSSTKTIPEKSTVPLQPYLQVSLPKGMSDNVSRIAEINEMHFSLNKPKSELLPPFEESTSTSTSTTSTTTTTTTTSTTTTTTTPPPPPPTTTTRATTTSTTAASSTASPKNPTRRSKKLKHSQDGKTKKEKKSRNKNNPNNSNSNSGGIEGLSEISRSRSLHDSEEQHDDPNALGAKEAISQPRMESGARVADSGLGGNTHPGMLVLLGAALGAATALAIVTTRTVSMKRKERNYTRHENIEVQALTPTTIQEMW